ncbi:MAG: hypothetical protein ABSH48_27555 [Verrucomicrobiota bacterium]|jgi:hypothetical protein
MAIEHKFKTTVEAAGAIFVKLENGLVYLQDASEKPIISLYAFACDRENVRLAIKSQREELSLDRWEQLI